MADSVGGTATSLSYWLQICPAFSATECYFVRRWPRKCFKECWLRIDWSIPSSICRYRRRFLIVIASSVYLLILQKASTAQFQHRTYRVITMVRGSMVSIIYRKTLQLSAGAIALDDSKPVTLMSSDVERIGSGMEFLHESWSNVIEIMIALWLLEEQLGIAFVSAIFVAIGSYTTTTLHSVTSD